jgi:aminoglycoside phosphotransferase
MGPVLSSPAPAIDAARSVLESAGLAPADYSLRVVNLGESGDVVAIAEGPQRLAVKLAWAGSPAHQALLKRELAVFQWLQGRARVPRVLWSGKSNAGWAIVSEMLVGEPVSHVPPEHGERALIEVINALARLHRMPASGCPFVRSLKVVLHEAEDQVRAGRVDETDFGPEHSGRTADALLALAQARQPRTENLVLTHGDACLPNFIWSPGGDVGFVDLGRFGLADPWQDLALFLRSAYRNYPGIDAEALLLKHYPIEGIDEERCAFYRLLDELF